VQESSAIVPGCLNVVNTEIAVFAQQSSPLLLTVLMRHTARVGSL
jgi:hypothetical protein